MTRLAKAALVVASVLFQQIIRETVAAGTTLLPDVENMRAELAALRAALSTEAHDQCGCLGSTISEYDQEG